MRRSSNLPVKWGITAIVRAAATSTTTIADGETVTASCCEGMWVASTEERWAYRLEEQDIGDLPSTRTQILVNVGNRRMLSKLAPSPVMALGWPDWNFIIANQIKVHPMALLEPERVSDLEQRAAIAKSTAGHPIRRTITSTCFSQGMARLGWPRFIRVQ